MCCTSAVMSITHNGTYFYNPLKIQLCVRACVGNPRKRIERFLRDFAACVSLSAASVCGHDGSRASVWITIFEGNVSITKEQERWKIATLKREKALLLCLVWMLVKKKPLVGALAQHHRFSIAS